MTSIICTLALRKIGGIKSRET